MLARILIDISEAELEFTADAAGAWDKEIEARVHAVRNGRATFRPIHEVFEEVEKRYPA